jgi:hypothetical protein
MESIKMTDREVLIGILRAVMAVGEKLTGQKMLVKFPTGDDLVSIGPTDGCVKWFSEKGEATPRSEVPQELPHSSA